MLPLLASVNPKIEEVMLTVLVQLIIIIIAARIFAAIFRWFRQPQVVGEIAAGLILGPSCFGYFFPELSHQIFNPEVSEVFGVFSQLGLILLLFLIGLEFDFNHLRWNGAAAFTISLSGIILPFALGAGLAPFIHPYLEPLKETGEPVAFWGFLLFMGTSMSITAIPILGRMMMELGITRTKLGAITISAAAVDDACGWIILATISSIVAAKYNPLLTLRMIGLTIGFLLLMIFVVRPLAKRAVKYALTAGRGELSMNHLAVLFICLFACAIATNLIGIFGIFGAFLFGTILSDEHEFREAVGKQFRNFVTVFFLPIFFTYTGLRTNIGTLDTPIHWLLLSGVLFAAIFGKLGGCGIAAKLCGFSNKESFIIGTMMNTRALMELIVINVGRNLGVIPDSVFCMLVLMALLTTVMTTPMILWSYRGTELEPFIKASGFLGPVKVKKKH